jgi:hypothetical protein
MEVLMPLQATTGAASYDAFGGGVAAVPNYIEDVFSTWLYTGNGSTQTITNGIDLAGKGGLVWQKNRSAAGYDHVLTDTITSGTGALTKFLSSNTTNSQSSNQANIIGSYNSDGFTLNNGGGYSNNNGVTAVSWTFREQPKFFDVVTYTGNGTAGRQIAHNLGSAPGCVIVKCTSNEDGWVVQHRSLNTTSGQTIQLDSTGAAYTANVIWNSTAATSTVFTVGNDGSVNGSGRTYVAYLFAHDAGGFGLTGTDNVISCGSYNSATAINLGYEPQWLMVKSATISGQWYIINNMTGFTSSAFGPRLIANLANAEGNDSVASVTATGFNSQLVDGAGTYIYIAIRRGPMKVPTTGTSVYNAVSRQGTGNNATISGVGFSPDLAIIKPRSDIDGSFAFDKLRGATRYITTSSTATETTDTSSLTAFNQTGISIGTGANLNVNSISNTYINWMFQRAPGFFDEVCYTGTGSPFSFYDHNLGVQPELIFVKRRNSSGNWAAIVKAGSTSWITGDATGGFVLNSTASTISTSNLGGNFTSTTARFGLVGNGYEATDLSAGTYVAYLFATCPGVSKVGSFTGTGATQTINCGFTGGARFVLIKATSTTGDWYVWDSARGIVAGNDPYLRLNSTAAEVTTTDWVDTAATGFELSNAGGNLANSSGVSYIFLAIA